MAHKIKTVEQLAKLVTSYERARKLAKRHYDRADAILIEIAATVAPDEPVLISAHRTATLIDQFAGKTILWGHGAVRKYDLKVSDC